MVCIFTWEKAIYRKSYLWKLQYLSTFSSTLWNILLKKQTPSNPRLIYIPTERKSHIICLEFCAHYIVRVKMYFYVLLPLSKLRMAQWLLNENVISKVVIGFVDFLVQSNSQRVYSVSKEFPFASLINETIKCPC